jgi:GNAT superfamily N-acetyltransferase
MSKITVRRARPEDFTDVQRLNRDLFVFEDSLNLHTRNLDWPYTDFAVDYFRKAVEGRDHYQAFVAEQDEQAVGYLIGSCLNQLYMSVNPVAEIENMFVAEPFRRSGAGGQLVEAFKEWAREEGAAHLKVGALTRNHPAVSFYRKQGFVDMEIVLEQSP